MNRGGEYLSHVFIDYLKENGILHQWSPPRMSQHNGVSEMRNHTLLDMVRPTMSHVDLPKMFWGYGPEIATYILNRVPPKSVNSTPNNM